MRGEPRLSEHLVRIRLVRRSDLVQRLLPYPSREHWGDLIEATVLGMLGSHENTAGAPMRLFGQLRNRVHRRHASVVGRQLANPLVAILLAERVLEIPPVADTMSPCWSSCR